MIKRQTTKDLLAESLQELMRSVPFERITVKDIVKNCELSSTTFYHHFQDKYDLVEWIYRKDSRQFVDRISDSYIWKDAALHTVLVFRSEQEYYRSYFRSTASSDSLDVITYAEALDTIRKLHGEECVTDEIRFLLQLYISGVSKMTVEWLLDERTNTTPEVLVERLMEAMPPKVKELLF